MNGLPSLRSKEEVDRVLRDTEDRVVVLRFGRTDDLTTMRQDAIVLPRAAVRAQLEKARVELSRMADAYAVEAEQVPVYSQYFDITLIPATLFFYNARHMKVDFRTQDHTKWIGAFQSKQDYMDLVECIYRGAIHGKFIVDSPIPVARVPKYELFYKGV